MPPCQETLTELSFWLQLLSQEQPFGLVPNFSEEARPLADVEFQNLTEEQAQVLLADIKLQRARFFAQEIARYEAEAQNVSDDGGFDDDEEREKD